MIKKLLISIFAVLSFYLSQAQIESTINIPYVGTTTTPALLYLPPGYPAAGVKYSLLFFFHGAGEAGTNLATIYNSSTAGGPAYFIEHSGWPADGGFVTPTDGVKRFFIVCSPQRNNAWSTSGDEADVMTQYMVSHYNIDTNRIYMTGLSAGGAGTIEYQCHLDPNEDPPTGGNDHPRRFKLAASVPMSAATNQPLLSWFQKQVADSIPEWGMGDQNNDLYGEFTQDGVNFINGIRSNYAVGTFNPPFTTGHGGWMLRYVTTFVQTINGQSMNMYQWLLTQTRPGASTAPVANAGPDQTVNDPPTTSVTLTGSATPGPGKSISSYAWTKTSGPNTPTITSPTSSTTTVTGLIVGVYTFTLTATQNDAQIGADGIVITVNNSTPVAKTTGNQTISLPTSSVTLDASSSTGTITSYAWTKVSGPNTPTIVSASSATTSVTGLIQGTYIFQISLNAGVSTAKDTIVVNAQPICSGTRKHLTPDPVDSSVFMTVTTTPSTLQFVPGDTIAFTSGVGYSTVELHYITGSPNCPIVFINEGGQAQLHGFFKIYGAKYVHIDGSAGGQQYGLKIQVDPHSIVGTFQNGVGLQISERSKVVEINNVFVNHTIFGMPIKQSPDCPDSLNYPNWVMDSISVHDNLIQQVGLEGMYIGDTSPDNSPTSPDPRPVTCNIPPNPDSVIYPRPIRSGHFHIYNNIVDSTQRGGIQLSGHSVSVAEINNNIVKHNGRDGDEQQGTGISIGMYTHAYIHDNIIMNNTTWGIASLGGNGTNIPLRIENNTFDSVGFGRHNSNVTDTLFPITPTTPDYGPTSGIPAGNDYTFAVPIFVKTVTNMDGDSTQFSLKGNVADVWLAELHKTQLSDSSAIQVFDYSIPVSFQKEGNFICTNTRAAGGPLSFFVDQTLTTVPFSTTCSSSSAPSVSILSPRVIFLPSTTASFAGTATPGSGASIVSYNWTQTAGPNTAVIGTPTLTSTNVTGLTVPAGQASVTYSFNLSVVQSDTQVGSATVDILVVNPNCIVTTPGFMFLKFR